MQETHSIADTLREVDTSDYSTDRRAILIAGHLDNPEVAKAKTVADAFKALQRQESRDKNIALAELVGQTYNSSSHQLIHGDCISWLAECPNNVFDVILTIRPAPSSNS